MQPHQLARYALMVRGHGVVLTFAIWLDALELAAHIKIFSTTLALSDHYIV